MNKDTLIDIFSISYLDSRGAIQKKTCHHNLNKAHEISKHLLATEDEWGYQRTGVFIQVEQMSAGDYFLAFGDSIPYEEGTRFIKEYHLENMMREIAYAHS
jgi:hypothetical protein